MFTRVLYSCQCGDAIDDLATTGMLLLWYSEAKASVPWASNKLAE